MASDNWDDLLRDLGAKPESKPEALAADPAAEPAAEAPADPSPAAEPRPEEAELPADYPRPKPSGWDSLADTFGLENAQTRDSGPSEPAPSEPAATKQFAATVATDNPLEEDATAIAAHETDTAGLESAAADSATEEVAEEQPDEAEADEPLAAPAPAPELAAESDPEPAKPRGGFSGWFPFAGRRSRAAEKQPAAEAVEAAAPPAELPPELFGDAPTDATPAADDLQAEGSQNESGDSEDAPTSDKPRRRRRRGGRRRRKASANTETEGAAAEGASGEIEEDTDGLEAVEAELADESSDELVTGDAGDEADRPKRRRRRRRRGGSRRTEEEASVGDDTLDRSEQAADETASEVDS
ncbi:MAG: hypothetical protein AAF805_15115, partial [Planctomycetota bacterium]